jgi:hypothetical protein
MTPIEYLIGLLLLIAGLNIGFHEANHGLSFAQIRKVAQKIARIITSLL